MLSSEGEVPANEVRTARDDGGIGQATKQLPVVEPNQHLQDGMKEEETGISDGIEEEWPLYEDASPPS
eukprot:7549336-Ditylum_brightwellii.AAC.1